jgi:hypothetical protein
MSCWDMPLDIKKFRRDAKQLHAKGQSREDRRETTGATKAIRTALPDIYAMRKEGMQWSVIAAALALQGVVEGKDRIPLTTNGLTARVSQIEQQERKLAAKAPAKPQPQTFGAKVGTPGPKLTLSAELRTKPASHDLPSRSLSPNEDQLRRLAIENVRQILKED